MGPRSPPCLEGAGDESAAPRDWQTVWKHPLYLADTFVDTTRYRGTCYRAAKWLYLGETAGRSKRGNDYLYGGTKKALCVYPLERHATRRLREGT